MAPIKSSLAKSAKKLIGLFNTADRLVGLVGLSVRGLLGSSISNKLDEMLNFKAEDHLVKL